MKIYIKYMVSIRCKMAVKEALKGLGLHFVFVDLGIVETMEELTPEQWQQLKIVLHRSGLELMDDKKAALVQQTKKLILDLIYNTDEELNMSFTVYLSQQTHQEYPYLANLFLEVQGTTIQQYMIIHKVERIKELIIYGELSISEITWKMNYSSVAHLSNQFKKITGLTPTHFRQLKEKRLQTMEDVSPTLVPKS
ncbi:MAG: helix-turn-helix transcriptional regulator [Flavobacteriia bacterium]|nr:helix-turn-helix transcriptional regulator [Flavobacteriia bacterium]